MTDVVYPEAFANKAPGASSQPPLPPGGGGGTSGGMETRVAVLEAHVVHIRSDLDGLRADVGVLKADVTTLKVDMATLKETVRHLPTKGFIVTVILGVGGVLAALTAFAPAIHRVIGLAP